MTHKDTPPRHAATSGVGKRRNRKFTATPDEAVPDETPSTSPSPPKGTIDLLAGPRTYEIYSGEEAAQFAGILQIDTSKIRLDEVHVTKGHRFFDVRVVRQTRIDDHDEFLISDKLKQYLIEREVSPQLWKTAAAEIERLVRKHVGADKERPLWDERARHPELANLSAPRFLKRVWADQIGPDGAVERDTIAQRDKKLLLNISAYISKRENRGQSLGDAEGLRFIGNSKAGRPKRRPAKSEVMLIERFGQNILTKL